MTEKKMVYAKDCQCRKCGKQAVAFWPALDIGISKHPYCRSCLDNAKTAYLVLLEDEDLMAPIEQDELDMSEIDHPEHNTNHPSSVECIELAEQMNFCLGNALMHLHKVDLKCDELENLNKALWYVEREIQRIESSDEKPQPDKLYHPCLTVLNASLIMQALKNKSAPSMYSHVCGMPIVIAISIWRGDAWAIYLCREGRELMLELWKAHLHKSTRHLYLVKKGIEQAIHRKKPGASRNDN